ncbi:Oidioi.mRNA.OKI2018_I69.chr1.g2254.t1.cds [Oikopleura dioica]|uniref:Oidioi.mRNA.OKI2018_I69.chr1.g2254.t1.cds n=1 Tax=Oikopleura dioica TaxID=34765 RepID=A0ABN7SUH0_OIKDI|nr:Oidioi.mRNA.OKI2018_I69.chr1.g2254.t1.cds [Oikopleura dioica]
MNRAEKDPITNTTRIQGCLHCGFKFDLAVRREVILKKCSHQMCLKCLVSNPNKLGGIGWLAKESEALEVNGETQKDKEKVTDWPIDFLCVFCGKSHLFSTLDIVFVEKGEQRDLSQASASSFETPSVESIRHVQEADLESNPASPQSGDPDANKEDNEINSPAKKRAKLAMPDYSSIYDHLFDLPPPDLNKISTIETCHFEGDEEEDRPPFAVRMPRLPYNDPKQTTAAALIRNLIWLFSYYDAYSDGKVPIREIKYVLNTAVDMVKTRDRAINQYPGPSPTPEAPLINISANLEHQVTRLHDFVLTGGLRPNNETGGAKK